MKSAGMQESVVFSDDFPSMLFTSFYTQVSFLLMSKRWKSLIISSSADQTRYVNYMYENHAAKMRHTTPPYDCVS